MEWLHRFSSVIEPGTAGGLTVSLQDILWSPFIRRIIVVEIEERSIASSSVVVHATRLSYDRSDLIKDDNLGNPVSVVAICAGFPSVVSICEYIRDVQTRLAKRSQNLLSISPPSTGLALASLASAAFPASAQPEELSPAVPALSGPEDQFNMLSRT